MAMNLGASYTLAGNIDLGSSLAAVGGKYPGMWSSAGFSPIGSTATKFTGAFNGQGYTIANLTINRPTTDDVGLFGYVGAGVTVRDVGLLGAAVTGSNHVGALAGTNAGTITRSYATGVVNGTATYVGGLVGYNFGTGSNVTQSYASVTVGSPSWYVGGLVGYNEGAIAQAYAVGAVSGQYAGGLAGNNSGTITQAYAAGAVSGSTLGGLVGNNGGTITQSYFDTVTTGQIAAIGNGSVNGGIGLTTSQMQNPANYATTYAGWDFANVWSAPSAGYYPQLYGVNYVLRVDPANALRTYGDANPAFTYSYYGLHTGDTSAILAGLSLSTAATTTSNVGELRDHGGRQRRQHRRAGLSPDPNACRADGHAARDHGHGRRQEPCLWRCQSGADLAGRRLGSGQWRYAVGRAGDVGDDGQQCRRLRDHARYAGSLVQLHGVFVYWRQPDGHAASDHGGGRCEEPRLWRCQPGADLAGRRRGPGQWRHAVGCAGDVGDDRQQHRRLRDHARHAGGLDQLHGVFIHRRQSHRHATRHHRDG